jgi:hypothetical protein
MKYRDILDSKKLDKQLILINKFRKNVQQDILKTLKLIKVDSLTKEFKNQLIDITLESSFYLKDIKQYSVVFFVLFPFTISKDNVSYINETLDLGDYSFKISKDYLNQFAVSYIYYLRV